MLSGLYYIYWICGSNQIAQIIGKPDLAPAAWVKRLVTLCDRAPATPFGDIQHMLEKELGKSIGEMFERFEMDPLGSASIAQVPTWTIDTPMERNISVLFSPLLFKGND